MERLEIKEKDDPKSRRPLERGRDERTDSFGKRGVTFPLLMKFGKRSGRGSVRPKADN